MHSTAVRPDWNFHLVLDRAQQEKQENAHQSSALSYACTAVVHAVQYTPPYTISYQHVSRVPTSRFELCAAAGTWFHVKLSSFPCYLLDSKLRSTAVFIFSFPKGQSSTRGQAGVRAAGLMPALSRVVWPFPCFFSKPAAGTLHDDARVSASALCLTCDCRIASVGS